MRLHALSENHGDVKYVWGKGLSGEPAVPGWAGGDRSLLQIGIWPLRTTHVPNMFSPSRKQREQPRFPDSVLHHNNKVNNGKNISPMARDTLHRQNVGATVYQQTLLRANQSLLTGFYE